MDPQIAEHNRNVKCTAAAMTELTTAIVIIILVDPFVAPIYMAVS